MSKSLLPELAKSLLSRRGRLPATVLVSPEAGKPLVMPELYCPFPSEVNQYAEIVDQETNKWVRQHHLFDQEADYRRFSRVRLGWLAARTHPSAPLATLQIVTDWCSWFFIRDDYYDECGIGRSPERLMRLHSRFLDIMAGALPSAGDTALTHALFDLCRRTLFGAATQWTARFTRNLERFFEAGVWEASNRAADLVPSVATYLKMRPYTGGLYAYMDLFEIGDGFSLPPEARNHPTVQRLTSMANNVVCWANDIMSLPKEMAQGDIHNIILSMRQNQSLTLQEAVNRAAALHDAEVRAFMDLSLRVPPFEPDTEADVARYLAHLRAFMRGSLDWLYSSGRYFVSSAPVASVM